MRLAIISDTHIHKHSEKIHELINRHFKDVDMIIHAGDYTDIKLAEILKTNYNFMGVWGNVDKYPLRKMLKEDEILDVEGYKIGIFHGHGREKTTLERAYDRFKNENPDIIIFGHSHKPLVTTMKKTLMLNPGSITYKRQERWHSCIILDINKNGIKTEVKFFI